MKKTATSKQATEATILYKVTIKRNGMTIYVVEGSDNRNYYVTLSSRGTISSCVDADENSCKGFLYRHTCKHTQAVEQKIAERDAKRTAENNFDMAMEGIGA